MIHGLSRPADGDLIAYVLADNVLRTGFYDHAQDQVRDTAVADDPEVPFRDVQQWASIAEWWASDNRTRQVRFAPDEKQD